MGSVIREQFYRSVYSGRIEELKKQYQSASPFPHGVLIGTVEPALLAQTAREFPLADGKAWWGYENALEKKLARDDFHNFPDSIQRLIHELYSARWMKFLQDLTGIQETLIPDPFLNGGGLHMIKPGGKLDIHADYNYHPKTRLDRRLNVIIYLNENWREEWGGHLELWNRDMTQCGVRIPPFFNHMVIFNVNDWAYHGHPDPLKCPDTQSRKSIALYYYTNGRPAEETTEPHSVIFKKRPQDSDDPETEKLRQQRIKGRL